MEPVKDRVYRIHVLVRRISPWVMTLGALIVVYANSLSLPARYIWDGVGVTVTVLGALSGYIYETRGRKYRRGAIIGGVFVLAWEVWIFTGVGHLSNDGPGGP